MAKTWTGWRTRARLAATGVTAFPGTLSGPQQQLATVMKEYWTNFAKRGFPSSVGAPFWPLFSNLTQKMQSLAPPTPHTGTGFAATHNCAFWTALEAG